MATIDELHAALMKADAAGDSAGAKALADHIRSMPKEDAQPVSNGIGQNLMKGAGNLLFGAAKGLADTVQGPAQVAMHGMNAAVQNAPFVDAPWNPLRDQAKKAQTWVGDATKNFDQSLSDQEKFYQDETPGSIAAGAGRVGSSLLPFMLTGGVSALPQATAQGSKLASALRSIGSASAKGGAYGVAQPVHDVSDNFLKDKAIQGGVGSGLSMIAAPLGAAASRVIKPKTAPEAKALIDQGVTLTPGQILGGTFGSIENKATSIPIVGDAIKNAQRRSVDDVNIAAYKRALNPIGKEPVGKAGHEGIQDVSDKLSGAYNELLPRLQFRSDPQFVSDTQNLTQLASNLPAPQAAQFTKIFRDKLYSRLGPQGTMDGKALKGVESELGNLAKGYHSDASFDNRQLGDAVSELQNAIRSNLQRTNPDAADELKAINTGYANYARLRGAAASSGAVNGVFTPAQLQAAVRGGDKSVGKGDFAKGNALMQDLSSSAKNTITNYPDSGTVGRGLIAALSGAALAPTNPGLVGSALAGGAMAMAPYTQIGQKMAQALLAKRPKMAEPIANAVRSGAPFAGAVITPALLEALNGNSD